MTRTLATPLAVPRTRRKQPVRNMMSLPAGKVVPIMVQPLLREDAYASTVQCAFEMQETVEILLNGVDVVVEAWIVPNLADPRFRTMDDLNLAYTGNARPGETAVPYFVHETAGDPLANEIHMRLGKHAKPTDLINMSYIRAYNALVNHSRLEASPRIPQRELNDRTLAQSLWPRNLFGHIVPDWDQARMEGEVALSIAEQNLALMGPGGATGLEVTGNPVLRDVTGNDRTLAIDVNNNLYTSLPQPTDNRAVTNIRGLQAELAGAVAVLQDNGVTISLANIDLARKAQIFADIRRRYNGLDEEMLIDLLMDGIAIPEQQWRKPIKLKTVTTQFGMAKRYSSDANALTESVVNGAAAVSFPLRVPRIPCGGILMVVAYIAPEQMFERMEDPYLHAQGPDDLPSFLPDHLDPEAVEVVYNRYIDIDHDQPTDIYGYAPTNHEWNMTAPGMGGRFYRPEVDAGFDEDRQALWAVETANPRLTEDAYLVPADIHLKPFWTSTIDPFDVIVVAPGVIEGNTQFGPALIESMPDSDYNAVMDRVDIGRIVKPATP